MRTSHTSTARRDGGLVWDWPVRVFHWLLAACVAGAWLTHHAGLEWFPWHRRLGYVTLVLVGFRIAWGLVGPRYARFGSFLTGPAGIADYVGRMHTSGLATPGHNPLGALSVVAFLLLLLLQAATGLFANDEVANAGPFFGWVDQATSDRLSSIHHFNSNVLLALIGLHLLAIAYYDLVRKSGLTRALLTGRKAGVDPGDGITGSRGWLALAIVVVLAVALAVAIRAAPEATISFF